MELYDLHTDTATKLYSERLSFTDPALAGGGAYLSAFSRITRVFAIFSASSLADDGAYQAFFPTRKRLLAELSAVPRELLVPILAVEDARLLAGKVERISALYSAGVRILTLLWRGCTCIGGAWDTNIGLTSFGKDALNVCIARGIIPDVSHASDTSLAEITEIAARRNFPILATHSNSRTVCRHRRNLEDWQFAAVRDLHGLVGLSLYPPHLSDSRISSVDDVIRHLDRFLTLGGEDTVAIGTDFDGIETTPEGLTDTDRLASLADAMRRRGYPEPLISKLFYKNAEKFFGKYLKRQELP